MGAVHDRSDERVRMVHEQIAARGVRDPRVLEAMAIVPREAFVAPEVARAAYHDTPLPIASGQTISQPYIVAAMAEALALTGDERVLEVGSGSGYAAAVLGCLAKEVWSMERHPPLAELAAARLALFGAKHVHVVCGDGTAGLPEHAPFDAISVAAAAPVVPRPLVDQLAPGGRLVMPVGDREEQQLMRFVKVAPDRIDGVSLGPVRFVPLLGEQPSN